MNEKYIGSNLKSVSKGFGMSLIILLGIAGFIMFIYYTFTIGFLYGLLYGVIICGLACTLIWAISGALYGLGVLIENSNKQTNLLQKVVEQEKNRSIKYNNIDLFDDEDDDNGDDDDDD